LLSAQAHNARAGGKTGKKLQKIAFVKCTERRFFGIFDV